MRQFCLGFGLFCLQTVCATCEIPFVGNSNKIPGMRIDVRKKTFLLIPNSSLVCAFQLC